MIRRLLSSIRRRLREEAAGFAHCYRVNRDLDLAQRRKIRAMFEGFDELPCPWWHRRRRRERILTALALIHAFAAIAGLVILSFLVYRDSSARVESAVQHRTPDKRSP